MTPKDIYCMGRAEYLCEFEGCSLSDCYEIAIKEWHNAH